MKRAGLIALVLASLPVCSGRAAVPNGAAPAAPGEKGPEIVLPGGISDYRSWTQATDGPHAIPFDWYFLCREPSPEEWERARRYHGPHTKRFVQVYANPMAADVLLGKDAGPFPMGSIIAKEKLLDRDASHPEGIGFMVKRAGAAFKSTGGWEFQFFPSTADPKKTHAACAACHIGSRRDYVLGSYGNDVPVAE